MASKTENIKPTETSQEIHATSKQTKLIQIFKDQTSPSPKFWFDANEECWLWAGMDKQRGRHRQTEAFPSHLKIRYKSHYKEMMQNEEVIKNSSLWPYILLDHFFGLKLAMDQCGPFII